MRLRRLKKMLIGTLSLIVLVTSIEVFERLWALLGCESEGISDVHLSVVAYANTHGGSLPTKSALIAWNQEPEREKWRGSTFKCNKGVLIWNEKIADSQSKLDSPFIWCRKPHGFLIQWRNVIFDNLSLRRVPEGDFQQMMKGKAPHPISFYVKVQPGAPD